VKHSLPAVAFTGLLAGCANIHERPLALGTDGLDVDEVLRVERADLELASTGSRARRDISAIEAVEDLRCITLDRIGAATPRCDYRLRYRRPDGTSATKMRKKRFFQRDPSGRWESVIIVMSA
jgi:hypothetical protein